MKIAELLRTIADIVDAENSKQDISIMTINEIPTAEETSNHDIDQIAKLAGIAKASTNPEVHVFPLSSAFPAGDDFHFSKKPSDMRSDSVSLYPSFTAMPKE